MSHLADFCLSVDYGYTTSAVETPVGPKLLRITDIVDGNLDWEKVPYCRADARISKKFRLHAGDIVIARTGATTGVSAFLSDPPDAVFASYLVRLKIDAAKADAKFISYYLKGPEYWGFVQGVLGDKSAQPNASAKTLTRAPATIPSTPEQRSIASVLSALDDKIEQNRRAAQALEKLAYAIFRAWFVDFEPVKAKAVGATSFPSMPQLLFDSLPTRFVNSEAGLVPEDWENKPLANLATFLNGLALQKYPPTGDGSDLPVIKIAQLRQGSTLGADWANAKVPGEYIVNSRDLLFSWSGTLEAEFWFGGKGALNQHIFKVSSQHYPNWFCLLSIREHLSWFRTIAASKATTMGHINREHLQIARVVVAKDAVIRAADEIIGPLYALRASLLLESHKLATTRDYLLPRLLTGQVRVLGSDEAHD